MALFSARPAAVRADASVFGPVTCQRGSGAATRFEYAFKTAEPSRGFVLKVYNGGLEDTTFELVSSSTVTLNGNQVLGPSAFNQNVAYTEVPVALLSDNTLAVEVRGKPGGAMIVKIHPLVVIDAPAQGQAMRSEPIVVSGRLHAAADTASVNGVPAVISGDRFTASGVPLIPGDNSLMATARHAGGFAGSDSVNVVLDSVPPGIAALAPPHDTATADAHVAVTAGFGDDLSGIDVAGCRLALDGADVTARAEFTVEGTSYRPAVVWSDGEHRAELIVRDRAGNAATANWSFTVDTIPPAITVTSPPEGATVTAPTIDLAGRVDDPTARVSVNGVGAPLVGGAFEVPGIPLAIGENMIIVEAVDRLGNRSVHALHVLYAPPAPTVSVRATPDSILRGESAALSWTSTDAATASIDQGIGAVAASGSLSVEPTATTTYRITAEGPGGTATATASISVTEPGARATLHAVPERISAGQASVLSWSVTGAAQVVIEPGIGAVSAAGSLTVRPSGSTTYRLSAIGAMGVTTASVRVTVEGAVAAFSAGSFGKQYQSLVPPDATIPAYAEGQLSLVSGTVTDSAGTPISGVSVTVHGRPELGTASTDGAGTYVLPVEGGTAVTLALSKPGFLRIHRSVEVGWNDFVQAEAAVMIPEDALATKIELDGNPGSAFVHRSSVTLDASGPRAASVIIPGDTGVFAVTEAGEVPLTSFELRATEYAVPEAMPARLPPASAYTYCVDISASGLENVRFSKPVAFLVENFLGFPVGEAVPVGYYDFRQARWVPSENGRVVALLDTDGDGATDALDASGDGLPDDLNANGSVADEAFGLDDAARFPPGATFWRTMIAHLSPWDCNWPWGFPGDATPPNPLGSPFADQKREKDPVQCTNSYVERLGRVYHEDLPVPGTDLTLHYASDRVPGYRTIVYVPASGQSVPASLRSIVVKLEIAGRELVTELPPAPRQIATFAWDGRDALGRPVSGLWKARARIGFVYGLVMYGALQAFERSFGAVGSSYGLGPGRTVGISWKEIEFEVDRPAQLGDIADGWTISAHHQFLPSEPTRMYRGDGSTLVQETRSLATLAGTYGWDANGGTYVCSALCYPRGMGVDRAGNLYVGDLRHHRVVKVSPAGTISAFAGQVDWTGGFGGDGGPAISARFKYPGAIAVDPEGNVFIVDLLNARVRKVDSRGVITTVAGNGSVGFSPDNTPAVEASLGIASGTGNEIAVDRWGNLYIAEARNHRVRKVGPDGLLTTVAGNGVQGYGGNGRALGTNLDGPCAVATDAAGNLYISENATSNGNRYGIKRVTPDGRIARIAGGGTATGTEGVPALQASLDWVTSLLADQVGDLYFIDRTRGVCKVDAGGVLSAVSGGWRPGGLAMDASGALYVLGSSTHIVQKIRTPATDQTLGAAGDHLITDEGLGHVFSPSGLHLATVDLETRATLVTFGYREGRLSSVTDRHGNVTEIVRDAAGNAAAIVAPGGQRTELTVRGGMLETVSYPDGGLYEMAYAGGGLMVEQWDPNGNRFSHSFDDPGRLQRLRDPEGGDWMWDRAVDVSGRLTTTIASAEGDVTSYEEAATWSGVTTTQAISPDGSQSTTSRSANGLTETVEAGCGTNVTMSYSLDPVWLYRYPYAVTESTPSGRTRRRSVSRSHRDTNGDKKVDAVTESYVLNGRTATRVNSSLTGEMTLTSAGGRATAMMYDPGLLLVSEVGVPGLSPLKYRYDVAGRITDIDVGQRSTRLHYDGAGNLDSIVDADGRTSTYAHDAMGRLISEMRPGGVSLAYQYDPNGNLTVLTNPNAVSSSFDYTANNQRAALIPPLSGSYQYRYGRDRRLTAVLLPSGRTISSVYAAGTLEATVTPEGRIDYDHLCGGRLSRAARGGEIVQLSYDGPLMTADARSGTLAGTVGYAYNSDFAVSSVTYAGATVNLGYDADGLLTQAGVYAIARDARNGLPLGVSGGGLVLERTFNGYGELDAQSWTVAGGAAYDWAVTRDLAGRIVSRSESVAGATVGWSYRYDSAGRLVEVERDGAPVEQYTYDPNGNRLSEMNALRGLAARAYTHSVEDHTLTAGSDSFVFDVDGFLRSSTTARGTATFEYSSRGELLRAVLPDETIVTYVHDPFGRRIVKQVDGVTVEKYLWADRTTLLAVYDGSDNLVQRYAYADGRVPVSMTAGGATHFLLTDQVGSLRAVADSSGAIVKRVDYDSFGNIIADTNPAFAVPFGFAGGLHDRDTGLVRFGFRDYAPELGRFTAKDPIDFAGGDTNLYAYAMSDPINLIDRLGLWNWDVHSGTDRSDYGTYTWARDLGISSVIASSIALANNAADEYGNWAPVVGNPGRHFDTAAGGVDSRMLFANLDLALAARQYKAGKPCQAYQTLGRGLHSVQDIPAHMGWTPLVPHPAWYDNVLRRPDALRATEIATKAYLLQFLQGIGQ